MGLFKKKEKFQRDEVPRLPELPGLPELPEWGGDEFNNERISQLPSFPNGSLGDKFSQNTIKEAVTGEREDDEVDADESEERQMMQKPLIKSRIVKEYSQTSRTREAEPIFIRIDKFEEGSKTFEQVKDQVAEIEKMLNNLKGIKEKEEAELNNWEEEIKRVKEKIERIDSNIFSKIE